MREIRDILELWRACEPAVLATLVRVEGSSYRRAGARLLIAADGRYAGAISGGCLEAELIRKARWSVRGGAVVQRFSTQFDDTADVPYGLGCGGTVDVLLEPADTAACRLLMEGMQRALDGEAQVVRTWLPKGGAELRREVRSADEGESTAGDDRIFKEVLRPAQRLVIFGAGDDARPVAAMADLLGWRVAVADGRSQWATAQRFPHAATVQVLADAGVFPLAAADAVVIMTHSFEQDRQCLLAALRARTRYLGLLGSRHRSALLMSEAAAMLGWPVEAVCEQVFAPVGLDLGGDGAHAVALAIVAEVQAAVQGKLGASQRMTAEAVAQQIAKGGASRYLQTQCAL